MCVRAAYACVQLIVQVVNRQVSNIVQGSVRVHASRQCMMCMKCSKEANGSTRSLEDGAQKR